MAFSLAKYIRRHWFGGFPFWVGLFGIGVGIVIWSRILTSALEHVRDLWWNSPDQPEILLALMIFYQILFLPIFIWWIVGLWRASGATTARSLRIRLQLLWKAITLVIVCLEVLVLFGRWLPETVDIALNLLGDPEWGAGVVRWDSAKSGILIQGPITEATVTKFVAVVGEHPTALTVILDSTGGRLSAAEMLKETIRKHRFNTLVEGQCSSACLVAYFGGVRRIASLRAKFGFHASTTGGIVMHDSNREMRDDAIAIGVSQKFAEKAYPDTIGPTWYPSISELKYARIVSETIP